MPPLKGLVRGDVPLARAIFGDEKKRKLIPQLEADGWPFFHLAGKRCAYVAELKEYARLVGRRPRKGRSTANANA